MKTIIFVNFGVYLLVSFFGVYRGLNPRIWTSWLYGLYGLFTGYITSFAIEANMVNLNVNLETRFQFAALLAFVVMFGGVMNYYSWKIGGNSSD